jgi:hypothetical protein
MPDLDYLDQWTVNWSVQRELAEEGSLLARRMFTAAKPLKISHWVLGNVLGPLEFLVEYEVRNSEAPHAGIEAYLAMVGA